MKRHNQVAILLLTVFIAACGELPVHVEPIKEHDKLGAELLANTKYPDPQYPMRYYPEEVQATAGVPHGMGVKIKHIFTGNPELIKPYVFCVPFEVENFVEPKPFKPGETHNFVLTLLPKLDKSYTQSNALCELNVLLLQEDNSTEIAHTERFFYFVETDD